MGLFKARRERGREPPPGKAVEADPGQRLARLEATLTNLERALQVKSLELETLRAVVTDCPRCKVLLKGHKPPQG